MEKSKIEWTDYTWNPVTGCKYGCQYCYAEKISKRFCGDIRYNKITADYTEENGIYAIEKEIIGRNGRSVTYPFGFAPTLHKERLFKNCKPAMVKKPSTFFVCSTADLFGEWVPDKWIEQVFKICEENPRHRYMFLTKNPDRYCKLANAGNLPLNENFWYGTSVTKKGDTFFGGRFRDNIFLSIEPLLEHLDAGLGSFGRASLIIVGAETGTRKGKVTPRREWIENIIETAKITHADVFFKDSKEIREVWGDELIQKLPWGESDG